MSTQQTEKKKPLDPTATLRQQRRRQRLLEDQGQRVNVVLNKDQGEMLSTLISEGYAPDKSAALAKSIEETFLRRAALP